MVAAERQTPAVDGATLPGAAGAVDSLSRFARLRLTTAHTAAPWDKSLHDPKRSLSRAVPDLEPGRAMPGGDLTPAFGRPAA